MAYTSINIMGNIIGSDILEKIKNEEIKYQKSADFKLPTNTQTRDEIGLAWSEVRGLWNLYKNKLSRISEGETGTSETRNLWMIPFFTLLGYDLQAEHTAEHIADTGKSFFISHRAVNLDRMPVHISGIHLNLDERSDSGGIRVSPHALVQEYLNCTEFVYGLVTNGRYIRLLRDSTRLVRLTYLEFNLEKMMEEELFSEFAILYRLIHATRMPEKRDSVEESPLEFYHNESLASGNRIRNRLSVAVEKGLKVLADGFLRHPDNVALREAIRNGQFNADDMFVVQLRLIYRVLFLTVTEERHLIFTSSSDANSTRNKDIYYRYYSFERLRRMAHNMYLVDTSKHDLWDNLLVTFSLFENPAYGSKLGITPFGGHLFSYHAMGNNAVNLIDCKLENYYLLDVIRMLSYFESEQKTLSRVNYGDLDVEEFGSVYEGLLEYKGGFEEVNGIVLFKLMKGSERSKTGSHYTEEDLVKPLIKHSLDYLIEDREKLIKKEIDQGRIKGKGNRDARQTLVNRHLYSLKVCDVACGSGHILLSAARRIAEKAASIIAEEDQPNPVDFRFALRDVIKICIYGVDKNPLAVELCKVSLWLEAHIPGEPLSFLDHRIKCGDSIVGLALRSELENGIANEAFKTLPGDDKEIAAAFLKKNKQEREIWEAAKTAQAKVDFDKKLFSGVEEANEEYRNFTGMPEKTTQQIEAKEAAYKKFLKGKGYGYLKGLADAQVAQFFIPKTDDHKNSLLTDAEYRQILTGWQSFQDRKIAYANVSALEKKFFHWFLEFPEVFNGGGFDCILGNPPFLGGLRISTNFGTNYLNYLKVNYYPAGGTCDIVAYFFRRTYTNLNKQGFVSLISTNTISQGDTREGALDIIVAQNGQINFAIKSIKWPGQANLEVSLLTINKGRNFKIKFLNGKEVDYINPLLEPDRNIGNPYFLKGNTLKCFAGTTVLGKGFILEEKETRFILNKHIEHDQIILPYLSGEDINSSPSQKPSRYVINFFDWSEEKAQIYEWAYSHLKETVYPVRMKDKRKAYRDRWWQFAEKRVELYKNIIHYNPVIVVCRVTKHLCFSFAPNNLIYDVGSNVIFPVKESVFPILQSSIHEAWARKYGSSLETRLRYTNEDCFETFPFPLNQKGATEIQIENLGAQYHSYRKRLMSNIQLGLTKIYNTFHCMELEDNLLSIDLSKFEKKTIEKQFGNEVLSLWIHLQNSTNTYSFREAVIDMIKLRQLHVEMDNAVLEAYGWQDIQLKHDFYEVDYLPENDRIRYTIHPDARKEVLKRLLELNHKIHEEEVKEGLWDEKSWNKRTSKSKTKANQVNEGEVRYGGLFG